MKEDIIKLDLGGVNSYLIKNDNGFYLVDAGGHLVLDKEFNDRRDLLVKELDKQGVNKENLKLIILTHGDNDHVCNADFIRNKYEAPIAIHKNDLDLVENLTVEMAMKSFNYSSFIFKMVFKIMNKKILQVMKKTVDEYKPFKPDIIIDEDEFDFNKYGLDAKAIYTPGHTKGSISILTSEENLLCGDTFDNNKKPERALNALDFDELDRSIEKLKKYQIKNVYPGHGNEFKYPIKW